MVWNLEVEDGSEIKFGDLIREPSSVIDLYSKDLRGTELSSKNYSNGKVLKNSSGSYSCLSVWMQIAKEGNQPVFYMRVREAEDMFDFSDFRAEDYYREPRYEVWLNGDPSGINSVSVKKREGKKDGLEFAMNSDYCEILEELGLSSLWSVPFHDFDIEEAVDNPDAGYLRD